VQVDAWIDNQADAGGARALDNGISIRIEIVKIQVAMAVNQDWQYIHL